MSRRLIVTAALAAGLGLVAVGCSAGQITQTDTQVAAVDGASGNAGPMAVRNAMLAFPPDGNRYHEGDDVPMTFVIANTGSSPDKLLSVKTEATDAEAEIVGDKEIPAQYALRAEYDASHAPTKPSSSAASSSNPSVSLTPSSGVPSSGAPSSTGVPSSSAASSSSVSPTSGSAASSSGRPSGSSARPTSSSAAHDESLEVLQIRCTLKKLTKDITAAQTLKVTFLFEKAGTVTLEVPVAPSDHKRVSEGHESGGH